MLSKIVYNSNFPLDLIESKYHKKLLEYSVEIEDSILYLDDKIYGLRKKDRMYFIIDKKLEYVEEFRVNVIYNNKIFYKSLESFDQNDKKICNEIRDNVIKLLKGGECIYGIGGEYYIYFLFLDYKKKIGITNHLSIYLDSVYNNRLNEIESVDKLIDYNRDEIIIENNSDILINQFKINKRILDSINKNLERIKRLVIISCREFDKSKIKREVREIYKLSNLSSIYIYLF